MSESRRPIHKADLQRRVFSRSRHPRAKGLRRQLCEAVLMLLGGIGSLALLSWLSKKFNGIVILSEAIADLIRGISQLVEALLGFGSVVLIGAIVLLGLILFFGGAWRLLRVTFQFIVRNQNAAAKNPPVQRR